MPQERVLFFLYVVIVTALSLYPSPEEIIGDINDKIEHVAAFFLYIILFYFSFPSTSKLFSFLSGFLFGIIIEVLQRFSPNRVPDIYDILADLFGLLSGLVCIYILNYIKKRYKILYS